LLFIDFAAYLLASNFLEGSYVHPATGRYKSCMMAMIEKDQED